jgi:hypothetical protein
LLRALPSRASNEIDSDRGSLAALAAPAPLAIDFVAPLATPDLRDAQGCMCMQPKTKKERKPAMSDADQLSKDVLMQFTGSENWYRHALNRAVLFTPHQMKEALRRRDQGEPMRDIGKSFNVSHSTISRLAA